MSLTVVKLNKEFKNQTIKDSFAKMAETVAQYPVFDCSGKTEYTSDAVDMTDNLIIETKIYDTKKEANKKAKSAKQINPVISENQNKPMVQKTVMDYYNKYDNYTVIDIVKPLTKTNYVKIENLTTSDLINMMQAKRIEMKAILDNIQYTKLSISTQSAKAKMSCAIDLLKLAEYIKEQIDDCKLNKTTCPILGVLYTNIHSGIIRIPRKNKKGQFPNNCSILINSSLCNKNINIKCFKGGKITMTGCKIKEDGELVMRILESFIIKSKLADEQFKIYDYETTMVNSNYSLGYLVDRELLYEELEAETSLFASYSPLTYAGVKICYYYNTDKYNEWTVDDGNCQCQKGICYGDKPNAGKGIGKGQGECKKVTIAVFESGNVIITGGRDVPQTYKAYDFINKLFDKIKYDIIKIDIAEMINSAI